MEIRSRAIKWRLQGKTYQEINALLNSTIPKGTFSYWFRSLILSLEVQKQLSEKIAQKLTISRRKAVMVNKKKRDDFFHSLEEINLPISKKINDKFTAKIALAMLCLGEASKYGTGSVFNLGNTNYKIVKLFIRLLEKCFDIDESKFRCTVMCRADQNVEELEKYWQEKIGIPKKQFYNTRVDSRSIGKPTKKVVYKGVLKVDYIDTKVQLELESLASLVYNRLC